MLRIHYNKASTLHCSKNYGSLTLEINFEIELNMDYDDLPCLYRDSLYTLNVLLDQYLVLLALMFAEYYK